MQKYYYHCVRTHPFYEFTYYLFPYNIVHHRFRAVEWTVGL